MRNTLCLSLVVGVGLLPAAGCGPNTGLPPVAPASGRVTLDGNPLPCGTVTFVPDHSKGMTGPTGVGHIDKNGRYRISTARKDGALVGRHLVRIVAIDRKSPDGRWLIPPVYDRAEESGLIAEVKADTDNTIDFQLSSKR